MRPQCTTQQAVFPIGGQHVLLGQSLRAGVGAEPAAWIGDRFVGALLAAAVEGDAGAAGIHQPADAVGEASRDDVLRAERIDLIKTVPRAADARHAGDVKHYIHAAARRDYGRMIAEIAANRFHAERVKLRIVSAAERPNAVASGYELFDDVQAQKAAAAGN